MRFDDGSVANGLKRKPARKRIAPKMKATNLLILFAFDLGVKMVSAQGCSAYSDCFSCVAAPGPCGWCDDVERHTDSFCSDSSGPCPNPRWDFFIGKCPFSRTPQPTSLSPTPTASATSSAPSAVYTYPVTDAGGLGRPFLGIGAISGGGATSRLLLDYVEPARSQVLDYLFKPQFGASLQILKVEIGGSCDSTNGAEAPHRYTASEEPDFTRGYEWWLLVEAKKRNPSIKTYGLPWCWPAFIGNGTGNPFFDGGATAAAYVAEWITAARDVYNVTIDYSGLWNEKGIPDSYILHLRSALDAAGFASTNIVAADQGGWWSSSNATVEDAVYALGCHYPGSTSSPGAKASGKPLFASEDNSRSCLSGQNGGACWARAIVENAANGQMSGSISWSLINSWYAGIQFYGDGLMSAVQPWSGNYYVGAPIWSSAHTTQFTTPGWHYTRPGAGLGYLTGGGTYSTLGSGAGVWGRAT